MNGDNKLGNNELLFTSFGTIAPAFEFVNESLGDAGAFTVAQSNLFQVWDFAFGFIKIASVNGK